MDISQLNAIANQTSIGDAVGVTLLKKSLDSFTDTSANMTEMLNSCIDPNLGKKIDRYV